MSITFDFDPKEAVVGDDFLTPVYFDKYVLVKYLYDPRLWVEFASETYGTIYWPDHYMSFGINSQGTVIAWRGDLNKTPLPDQHHWKEHNIPSQHDMKSEFYDAQIQAEFTQHPIGIQAINALEKWNAAFAGKHGIGLYKPKSFEDRVQAVRRYRRIIVQSEDDFVRFISELNEIINENVDTNGIRVFLTAKGVKFDNGKKGNKLLEHVYRDVLGDSTNIIEPFFMLYDLRLWADHDMGDDKLKEVADKLGTINLTDFEGIFTGLLTRLRDALEKLTDTYG